MSAETKTPDISLELFGGILVADAAGYYPGLELMNYVYGCVHGILPDIPNPRFERIGQDFARRIVWDQEKLLDDKKRYPKSPPTEAAGVLEHLLKCLQLEVPDRTSTNWEAAHFFPYTRSLVHWDARKGRSGQKEVQIERRYLRGGGALAYKVLRQDPDPQRRDAIRAGFHDLMPSDNSTPLESLTGALARRGNKNEAVNCEKEAEARPGTDVLDDHYRSGIKSVLSHRDLSSTTRIRAVMIWTGFWLAVRQRDRSSARLDLDKTPMIIDCGSGPSQLRRESVRALKEIVARIGDAARDYLGDSEKLKPKSRQDLAGFFTRTLAWVGMLNSFKGRRYFVIKLDLLEALVLTHVESGGEMPFESFTTILYKNYGLVFGRDAAAKAGFLTRLDASIFEDNEEDFATQLRAAGLMHAYSDATRMVGTKALR